MENRETRSSEEELNTEEKLNTEEGMKTNWQKRKLNWVDLLLALLGIAVLYIALGIGTQWLASWWRSDKVLLYVNGFLTQMMFLILFLTIKKLRGHDWHTIGWSPVNFRKVWKGILALYVLTWILNLLYISYLIKQGFTPPQTDVYNKLLGNPTLVTYLLNILLAGVLAPVLEETVFRGIVFGSLQTYFGVRTAAVISSLIFAGLHFQLYGLFPRFILGMVLGYLYHKHKSLYPSMALHSLNNIIAVSIAGMSSSLAG